MDSFVYYTLGIDIPFNEMTSKAYSEVSNVCVSFIESSIEKIMRVIDRNGYISLARVFRIFEMKEQMDHPNIFFGKFDDYTLHTLDDGSLVVSIYLTGGFEQDAIRNRKGGFKPYIVPKNDEPLTEPKVTEYDKNGKPIAGRYPFGATPESEADAECQTGPKETSGSAENAKT